MEDRSWIVLIGFLAAAVFFLREEHRAHVLGILPWAILLARQAARLRASRRALGH